MEKSKIGKKGIAALCLVLALVSFFFIAPKASSEETYTKVIDKLDSQRNVVMAMAASAAGSSVAVSLLPDDIGSPIAEELADLSSDFLVILCAIFIEKTLLTLTGVASFRLIFPIAFLAIAFNQFLRNEKITAAVRKLMVLGLAIIIVIPTSVGITSKLQDAYSPFISGITENAGVEKAADEEDTVNGGSGNLLDKVSGLFTGSETGTETSKGETGNVSEKDDSGIGSTIKEKLNHYGNLLNDFIQYIAIMIVTDCVIPLIVMFFFLWLFRILFNIDINIPIRRGHIGKMMRNRNNSSGSVGKQDILPELDG